MFIKAKNKVRLNHRNLTLFFSAAYGDPKFYILSKKTKNFPSYGRVKLG